MIPCAPLPIDTGQGPALLLLHPFPLDHRAFAGAARALAAGARVIVPDLPGFGSAPAPAAGAPATMEAMAAGVAAALDARGVRPRLVAGNSMGGYVALALAESRPDLVPALALVDSRARADLPAERENRLRQIAELAQAADAPERLAGWMLPRLLGPGAGTELSERVRGWIAGGSPAGAVAALAGMAARADRTHVLLAFRGPLLLLAGEHDPITTPAEMDELAARLAEASRAPRRVTIPGAGHLPQLEREAAFVEALVALLGTT